MNFIKENPRILTFGTLGVVVGAGLLYPIIHSATTSPEETPTNRPPSACRPAHLLMNPPISSHSERCFLRSLQKVMSPKLFWGKLAKKPIAISGAGLGKSTTASIRKLMPAPKSLTSQHWLTRSSLALPKAMKRRGFYKEKPMLLSMAWGSRQNR